MRLLVLAAAAAVALAGAAQAQTARLSDNQYVALARCAGLAEGSSVEAPTLQTKLRAERRGRANHIRDQAVSARQSAMAEIRAASGDEAARLAAERDACLA